MSSSKITECYNCGYMTKCKKMKIEGKEAYLCNVCIKSDACKVLFYPSSHLEDGDILQMIAWGINYLKDEMRR